MPELNRTREDYPQGSIKYFLEGLMLGKNKVNKELAAFVMKNVPDDLQISENWFLEEVEKELLAISEDIPLTGISNFQENDAVQALIEKIKLGEITSNIIKGDN